MLSTIRTPNFIPRLTFKECRESIRASKSVIVPVAAMEPFGNIGAVGVSALCCIAICDRLSMETGVLLSWPVLSGHATPFGVFAGCAGAKQGMVESVVACICRAYAGQGCARVFIVDGSYDAKEALDSAMRRVRHTITVQILAWQHDREIRSLIEARTGVPAHGRCEHALLSMAASIDKSYMREQALDPARRGDPEACRAWRRRGRDPERYAKLFPDGLASDPREPDPVFGKELFENIVHHFAAEMQSLSTAGAP
ncbi:MAG: hypothetical protein GF418_08390 [Chitinivibrionales bacterium]|nr:hypothetical protein [Chitinivibrionales bacterium]MBD3395631.1 hypothetical protein [Chitinivibrionales bacterium]